MKLLCRSGCVLLLRWMLSLRLYARLHRDIPERHMSLAQRDRVRVWEKTEGQPGEWGLRVPLNEGICRSAVVGRNLCK